jgi:hypothetical protein
MLIAWSKPLFAWEELEDCPSLDTIRELLAAIPDGALLEALRQNRGRGRNDYSVSVLWGVCVLSVALRHTTLEACLAELHRNAALRQLIGIDSQAAVPKKWNLSRFQALLGEEPFRTLAKSAFEHMAERLAKAVPELGKAVAGDSTTLNARRSKEVAVDGDLPAACGGRKEYRDEQGHVSAVHEWHGYKLHLAVDVKHEVALAWTITPATASDGATIPCLLEGADRVLPKDRMQTFAYDKAADDQKVHELLHERQVRPLVQIRSMWKDELERPLPGMEHLPTPIYYDEAGTVYCYDMVSETPRRQAMAYVGYEKDRQCLKYRCPARQQNGHCPSEDRCGEGRAWGLTVRVPQDEDLRRFPSIPRATKKFERLYKGRTSVERVNARLKVFWGADDGNVTGARRFWANVSVVMLVHLAFATVLAKAPRREGGLGKLRLGPVQRALAQSVPKPTP